MTGFNCELTWKTNRLYGSLVFFSSSFLLPYVGEDSKSVVWIFDVVGAVPVLGLCR